MKAPRRTSGSSQPRPAGEYRRLWQTILGGREWLGEFHNRKKNGDLFWEAASISPIKNEAGTITHFVGVKEDITERKRLDERIRAQQERLEREVFRRIELEQARIGRDLHDGLCQVLVGAKCLIGALEKGLIERDAAWSVATAKTAEQMISNAIRQARELANGLNPIKLDANGLVSALQELAKDVEAPGVVCCDVRLCAASSVSDRDVANHLFRISQEAVQNAVKHGAARKIAILLRERAGQLVLSIEDDGKGFSASPEKSVGAGLHNMRMRAALIGGTLVIRPGRRGGSVVRVSLPAKGQPQSGRCKAASRPHGLDSWS